MPASPVSGGPAFPQTETTVHMAGEADSGYVPLSDVHSVGGMTLRDYFAAKAMQALINPVGEPLDRLSEVPEYAYQIADAMLAAREGATP